MSLSRHSLPTLYSAPIKIHIYLTYSWDEPAVWEDIIRFVSSLSYKTLHSGTISLDHHEVWNQVSVAKRSHCLGTLKGTEATCLAAD